MLWLSRVYTLLIQIAVAGHTLDSKAPLSWPMIS